MGQIESPPRPWSCDWPVGGHSPSNLVNFSIATGHIVFVTGQYSSDGDTRSPIFIYFYIYMYEVFYCIVLYFIVLCVLYVCTAWTVASTGTVQYVLPAACMDRAFLYPSSAKSERSVDLAIHHPAPCLSIVDDRHGTRYRMGGLLVSRARCTGRVYLDTPTSPPSLLIDHSIVSIYLQYLGISRHDRSPSTLPPPTPAPPMHDSYHLTHMYGLVPGAAPPRRPVLRRPSSTLVAGRRYEGHLLISATPQPFW
jgi:hypothetical protein